MYQNGKLIEEKFPNGGYKKYDAEGIYTEGKIIEGNKTSIYKDGNLVSTTEHLPNGGYKVYDANGIYTEGKIVKGNTTYFYKNGELAGSMTKEKMYPGSSLESETYYDKDGIIIKKILHRQYNTTDVEEYYPNGNIRRNTFTNDCTSGSKVTEYYPNGKLKVVYDKLGYSDNTTYYSPSNEERIIFDRITVEGDKTSFLKDGKLIEETFESGAYKKYSPDGITVKEEIVIEGDKTSFYEGGNLIKVKEQLPNGNGYKMLDAQGKVTETVIIEGDKTTVYQDGILISEAFSDGEYRICDAAWNILSERSHYCSTHEWSSSIYITSSGSTQYGVDYYSKDYPYLRDYGITYEQARDGYMYFGD